MRDTLGTPSLDLSGELFPDPGGSDSSLTYDVNLEENPGDWTSVCSELGKGLMVLFPDNVTGFDAGDLDTDLTGGPGLGPSPSFSLMAGDRIEVKEANILQTSVSKTTITYS